MAKPEWGTKRFCYSCGARFYDLDRNPPVCPKCETAWEEPKTGKGRRVAAAIEEAKSRAEAKKAAQPKDEDEIEDILGDDDAIDVADDDEDDDALIEDASDLGDDDMSEVIERIDGGKED